MKNTLHFLTSALLVAFLGAALSACAQPADNLVAAETPDEPPAPPTEPTEKPPVEDIACQGDVDELAGKAPSQTDKPEILGVCLGDNLSVVFTFYKDGSAKTLKPGEVSATIAKLVPAEGAGTSTRWQAYINRYEQPVSGAWPFTAKKLQATTENTGTLVELDKGVYAYTFTNPVTSITSPEPIAWEPDLTHRVGLEFRGTVLDPVLGNPTYTWVPETGKTADVTLTRDMVAVESCNECHNGLELHGRARTDTKYCVLCHNPGTTDANSGNTVDLKVMVHKIHMGKALPSVIAGTPYKIWGNRNSLHDFSTVGFPQDQRNCIKCHDPADAKTPDAVNYLNKPTIEACGSCHDDTSFDVGTTNHAGGAAVNSECFACHGPGKAYSADVAHRTPFITPHNPDLPPGVPHVSFALRDMYMANGTQPVVTFGIFLDGQPLDLTTSTQAISSSLWRYGTANGKNILSMPSFLVAFSVTETTMVNFAALGATYANLDFNNWFTNWNAAANKHEGKTTSGARVNYGQPQSIPLGQTKGAKAGYPNGMTITANLTPNGDGTFTTKPGMLLSVPANAKNVTVALQGYLGIDLNGNNTAASDERIGADSKVVGVGVNDTPRRKVVDIQNCDQCHERLSLHGGNRTNNPNLCVMCHNGNATDRGVRPVPFSPLDGLQEQAISFGPMVHRIHRGEGMYSPNYIIYGYGGSYFDFKEVRFPGKLNQCTTCHLPGTYQLPIADGALGRSVNTGADKASPWDDLNVSPTGSACTGCHDSPSAQAHAMVSSNFFTSALHGTENDSCAVCHGAGEAYDVKAVHGVK